MLTTAMAQSEISVKTNEFLGSLCVSENQRVIKSLSICVSEVSG